MWKKVKKTFGKFKQSETQTRNSPQKFVRRSRTVRGLYGTASARMGTFTRWPTPQLDPKLLARAGFFYTGVGDRVTCFYCDGTLDDWQPGDDPWVEHARNFPTCPYVHRIKGQAFINAAKNGMPQKISQPHISLGEPHVSSPIDDAMELPSVKTVLDMGFDYRFIRGVVAISIGSGAHFHKSADALLKAVVAQSEGRFQTSVTAHQAVSSSQVSPQIQDSSTPHPTQLHLNMPPQQHMALQQPQPGPSLSQMSLPLSIPSRQLMSPYLPQTTPPPAMPRPTRPALLRPSTPSPRATSSQPPLPSPQARPPAQARPLLQAVPPAPPTQRHSIFPNSTSSNPAMIDHAMELPSVQAVLDMGFDYRFMRGVVAISIGSGAGYHKQADTLLMAIAARSDGRFYGPEVSTSPVVPSAPPTETNVIDEAMASEPVRTVLNMGFEEQVVRSVVMTSIDCEAGQIRSADSLLEAVLAKTSNSPGEVSHNSTSRTQLSLSESQSKRELQRMKEEKVCKVCMDEDANTVFVPCGHLVCCDACASELSNCPICRTHISQAVRTYMS